MRLVQFSATLKLTLGHLCPNARVPGEDNSNRLRCAAFVPTGLPVPESIASLPLPAAECNHQQSVAHSSIAICPARPGQGSMESPIGCMTFSFALHVYVISVCPTAFAFALLPSHWVCCVWPCALLSRCPGRGKCNVWRVQHPRATSRAQALHMAGQARSLALAMKREREQKTHSLRRIAHREVGERSLLVRVGERSLRFSVRISMSL